MFANDVVNLNNPTSGVYADRNVGANKTVTVTGLAINGADAGDTKKLDGNKLIQPLGQGSYDVAGLLKMLKEVGYKGSVGFQGFAIKGDARDILTQTMQGWRRMGW